MFNQYKKFGAMLLAVILAAVAPAISDDVFTASEAVNVVIAFLGALAVLGAGNLPEGVWKYTKGYVAFASAVAMFVASAITDGSFTGSEALQAALAGLGAIGVVVVNGPKVVTR